MPFIAGHTYHVYNQGNNRKLLFLSREDYLVFVHFLRKEISTVCHLLAWCLMPNHFQLMIRTDARSSLLSNHGSLLIDPVSSGIRRMLRSTTRILNARYGCSGSMFRQGTKKNCLDGHIRPGDDSRSAWEAYRDCFLYIHRNPLKAGLVQDLRAWEFSSYPDLVGLRNGTLVDRNLVSRLLHLDMEDALRMSNGLH